MQGEARLARAPGSGQRHETNCGVVEESDDPCEVVLSSKKGRRLVREGMEPVGERPERGNSAGGRGGGVEDAFGLEQIGEAMFT